MIFDMGENFKKAKDLSQLSDAELMELDAMKPKPPYVKPDVAAWGNEYDSTLFSLSPKIMYIAGIEFTARAQLKSEIFGIPVMASPDIPDDYMVLANECNDILCAFRLSPEGNLIEIPVEEAEAKIKLNFSKKVFK